MQQPDGPADTRAGAAGGSPGGTQVEFPGGSLRSRIALGGAATIVVLIALVLTANGILLERAVQVETQDGACALAALAAHQLAPALESGDRARTEQALTGLFQFDEVIYAGVHDPEGRLVVAAGDAPSRPFGAEIPSTTTVEIRNGMQIVRSPVRDIRAQVVGVLSIGMQQTRGADTLRHARLLYLAMGLIFALGALGFGYLQARRITAPLLELASAVQAIGQGREPVLLPVRRDDEIGLVLRSFNEMAEHLHASRSELERQKADLEETVRRRTEELRRKNVELGVQNERVLEASRLKSDFVANISHELRTPLNAILALSELLRDEVTGPLANDDQRHQLGLIRQGGENLLRLINDLLDLSRIEAGKVEVKPQATAAARLLSTVADEMRPLAAQKGLELRLEVPEETPLWFDPDKAGQVLRNLVGNAIKFTERGWVRLSGRVDPEEERITFWVEDTGIGIAPQDQESVFHEFRQVDGSATRRHGGTGLGLAISRRLVRLMGGEIHVRSDLGQGSVFTFWVPAWQQSPSRLPGQQPVVSRNVLDLDEVLEGEMDAGPGTGRAAGSHEEAGESTAGDHHADRRAA